MEIDHKAPLVARSETQIAAPVEKVWALLTHIDGWPAWQPGVSAAKLEGGLSQGSIFRWKANGLSIVSTIRELEPERHIGWTGESLGTYAVHLWYLEPRDQGTYVRVEESLSGWFPRLLKLFMPRFLQKGMEQSLDTLKTQAQH